MVGLGPLEFVDQGDQILFRFEEFDIVPPIMMGADVEANRTPLHKRDSALRMLAALTRCADGLVAQHLLC